MKQTLKRLLRQRLKDLLKYSMMLKHLCFQRHSRMLM